MSASFHQFLFLCLSVRLVSSVVSSSCMYTHTCDMVACATLLSCSLLLKLEHFDLLFLPRIMGPRRCAGLAEAGGAAAACCFNPWQPGAPAQGKYGGHCAWCSPARLRTMSEDPRLRKLLAAALVEFHRLDEAIYEQARARVEKFAPERAAEIMARHDELYKPQSSALRPQPVVGAGIEDPAPAPFIAEPAVAPSAAGRDVEALRARPAAAVAVRQQLCSGYSAAVPARRRCRKKTDGGGCVFSIARPGQRARSAGLRCVFCSPERMREAVRHPAQLQNLKAHLNKFAKKAGWVHLRAHERLQRHLPRSSYKKVLTPKHCCEGSGDELCIFSCARPGQPARLAPGASQCSWCDSDSVRLAATQIRGRCGLAAQLTYFQAHCAAAYARADLKLRAAFGDDYAVTHLAAGRAGENRQVARRPRRRGPADWTDALKRRRSQTRAPDNDEQARRKYRKKVLDDQNKVQKSFFPDEGVRADRGRGDAIPASTGPLLPPAEYSQLSRGLESWCQRGSWAMCPECHTLQPRPLHEIDLVGDPKVDLPQRQCRRCSAARRHYVPKPEDVPEQLQGLSAEAVSALRLLDVDVGPETRSTNAMGRWNGYRKKVKMITFLWAETSAKHRVRRLEEPMRRKAKEALAYLLATPESAYGRFHALDMEFLARHGTSDHCSNVSVISVVQYKWGQTAHSSPTSCRKWYGRLRSRSAAPSRRETRRHAQRPGALARAAASAADAGSEEDQESGSDQEEAGDDADLRRTSVKRSFLAKCLSPLLGYGSTYELVQFVYDLNLWATLGAKKNLGYDTVPMRLLMKGHPPLYWKEVHNGLVDLVRQVGLPRLFFTIAPWYHAWLEDEMRKTLRARMNLPVAETLHMTHVLLQVVRGFLAGNNQQTQGREDRQWKRHVFSAKDAAGQPTRVLTFTRVEFQDGSRKEGTKRYEGSGRPHLHVLFFTEDMPSMKLEHHLFATKPGREPLKGYVHGSQRDRKGGTASDRARWPLYDGEPGYNDVLEKLLLQRTEADYKEGLRVFCADLMDAIPCHQDWQAADGEALLLQYVSKYVAKFSDSSYDEWMSDQASADGVARRVCFEYHPYEPEMILQLCGAQLRQYDISTVAARRSPSMAWRTGGRLPSAGGVCQRLPRGGREGGCRGHSL